MEDQIDERRLAWPSGRPAVVGCCTGIAAIGFGAACYWTESMAPVVMTVVFAVPAIVASLMYLVPTRICLHYHDKMDVYVVKGSPASKAAERAGMLIAVASFGLTFGLGGLGFAFLL